MDAPPSTFQICRVLPLLVLAVAGAGCGAAQSSTEAVVGSAKQPIEAGSSRIVSTYATGERTVRRTGAFDFESDTGMFEGPGELGPQIIRRNVIYEPAEDVLGDLDGAVGEGHDGYTEFVTANTRFAYEFASFGGSTFPI